MLHSPHLRVLLTAPVLLLAACGTPGPKGASCTVRDNRDGTHTISCEDGTSVTVADGTPGTNGVNGTNGTNGADGSNGTSCTAFTTDAGVRTVVCSDGTLFTVVNGVDGVPGKPAEGLSVSDKHGTDALLRKQRELTGKFFADVAITAAAVDATGTLTVDFRVRDELSRPVTTLNSVAATVAKLVPAVTGEASNHWEPYVLRLATVPGPGFPRPAGTQALQGDAERNGTFTNNGDGTYRYRFATNLQQARYPVADGGLVGYQGGLTHRVVVMVGGAAGPTGSAHRDFVPSGGAVTEKRDIVQTATCRQCHGVFFSAHDGDRTTVETCVTCHNPSGQDPESGNTLDFVQMIHKIHAGGELASIPGPDGIVWDNPATPADESADNGSYAFYGEGGHKYEWWKAEFPAVADNCTKCHQGSGANADNWKTKPGRTSCGACHDLVDFDGGTNHTGGVQPDDVMCASCHPATGAKTQVIHPIDWAHDFLHKDPRNNPEFDVDLSVSTPANGAYFVAGERPVVTIVLRDHLSGQPIDHTTLLPDPSAEGCLQGGNYVSLSDAGIDCVVADGRLATSSFFVHGPRARRNPVLTSVARVKVVAPDAGPYDLSSDGGLALKLDDGEDLRRVLADGTDAVLRGTVWVPLPASRNADAGFLDRAAATGTEVRDWLNKNAGFRARAIAYVDDATGRVAVRSRNLGQFFALKLDSSSVAAAVFGNDLAVKTIGGSTAINSINKAADGGVNDPLVTYSTGNVTYRLDPVDDLAPGTYVASVELADRGRVDANNYKTPSVAWVTFQVGQAAQEKAPAGNCASCHQNATGQGFVLDWSRHNKLFGADAVDQCGACHDYQSREPVGNWSGAGAIARRVHAVHNGSKLNYPLLTVGYANGDPVAGRNWDITFPQDIRNCETCHPADSASGSWRTKAARLPCGGCHDSDPAIAHMSVMTMDPTRADPFNGDEKESCQTCHR